MTERRRRWIDVGLLTLALIGIFTPLVTDNYRQDQRADDQEAVSDWLAKRDAVQADLIDRNEQLIAQLAEVSAQREEDRLAFELAACRFGNHAKRIARGDAAVAISILIEGLRASPHSAALVDQIEADIAARMSTAEKVDHDCSPPVGLGPEDYPPD